MAGWLFRYPVCGGLPGVSESYADSKHQTKSSDMCAGKLVLLNL